MVDFKSVKLTGNQTGNAITINEIPAGEIAIIGMAAKFPLAESIDTFWNNIAAGMDCIGKFPEARRKDADNFLHGLGEEDGNYFDGAYLKEIDKFDYAFFRLSPKEASLMSPNQRLFLETAWNAIEDAGYGGKKLIGSRTGVYLGFEADALYDYKRFIAELDPGAIPLAVPGNLTPIIASRLSYLLDLRGPSLSLDTACSSALVAIHLACRAIRNKECEMAIAGSIRLNLLPIQGQLQLGVESADGRARTFDNDSDGTGSGEGVGVLILKPLSEAIKDRDQIHAVIKGSAVNQDGSSIGITAPNVLAQEDVIVNAWKDAGIDPETIACIEAHGTGTRLGDPIEIDGIQRAFRRYTSKRQFCAVGSIKTNIGHLDNAAGVAGVIKMVQALKAHKIPPTLHFNTPHRQIHFEQSPVYINDQLREWEAGDEPRRCGISSFGFSGTNCHLILEEAPSRPGISPAAEGTQILTLSAQSQKSLQDIVQNYHDIIVNNTHINLNDLCYTANTGRGQYNIRLAFTFENAAGLKEKLNRIATGNFNELTGSGIYFGEHKRVPSNKEHRDKNEFSEAELKEFTRQARQKVKQFITTGKTDRGLFAEICALYVQGAETDWEELYLGEPLYRISLPVYPFERKRCWVKPKNGHGVKQHGMRTGLPLLDYQVTESMHFDVYATEFSSEKHWVLNEHRIMGNGVLVGTTYLEMAIEAFRRHHDNNPVEISEVVFITPFMLQDGEQREIQLVFKKEKGYFGFEIISKPATQNGEEPEWVQHGIGKLKPLSGKAQIKYQPEELKAKYSAGYSRPDLAVYNNDTVFTLGPRWRNIKEMYVGETELLSYIEMPKEFTKELADYTIYPSLLDNALTTIPLLQKNFDFNPAGQDQDLFLPFSYQALRLFQPLPAQFYSYVRLNRPPGEKAEIASFTISLMDLHGEVIMEIDDYCLKRVHTGQFAKNVDTGANLYHQIGWVNQEIPFVQPEFGEQAVLILNDEKGLGNRLISQWRQSGRTVFVVEWGTQYRKNDDYHYRVNGSQEDYRQLLDELKVDNIGQIYHLHTLTQSEQSNSLTELNLNQNRGVKNLFHLTKAILDQKINAKLELLIITEYAGEVTGREEVIIPGNAALLGFSQVICQEYPGLSCKGIDIDATITLEQLVPEFQAASDSCPIVAYRDGRRYVREFQNAHLQNVPARNLTLKKDGVYVITGGTGGIGLEVAKFLSAKNQVNLALLNRSRFPEPNQWEDILQEGADLKLCAKIRTLAEIEKRGSQVSFYNVDVAQYDALKMVIGELRAKYGRVNGLIHSAGIAGDGLIIHKPWPVSESVLAPKVNGTWNLDRLTQDDPPDFMVLFSSVTSLTGAPGQSDYTAANAYLDSFAAYRSKLGRKTLTINWAGWQETGMAVDYQTNNDGIFNALSTAQAIKAFEYVLNKDLTRIQVGELNYHGKLGDRTIFDLGLNLAEDIQGELAVLNHIVNHRRNDSGNIHSNQVRLKGRNDKTYSDLERKVAGVWGEVLGYDELNVYDSFYQLGGDSISMMKIISQMGDSLNLEVNFRDFVEYNTIHDLVKHISDSQSPGKDYLKIVYPATEPDLANLYLPFPLTDVQTAYLFGRDERFEMGGISTHAYLEIETGLNLERFQHGLRLEIERHPMLRAIILPNGMQRILEKTPDYRMEIGDLRHLDRPAQEQLIYQERQRMSHYVFPGDQWPLYEFKAFRLTDETNYLFIGFDVMIADAYSLQLIFKEILDFYHQPKLKLPELKFTFRDYLLAYREFKNGAVYMASKDYWLAKLEDFPTAPVLPLKQDPAGVVKPRFERLRRVFEKAGWVKLKKKAQNQNITPSALLCTVYADILAFWSNQSRLAINLTVFNRYPFHPDIQQIAGDFTSVIVLGLELPPHTHFWEKARQVQNTLMEALEHRHYDGVEFIREIARFHNLGTKAVMPIVFTSMFFDKTVESEEPGIVKMGLTQTPQVYIDYQATEKNGDLIVQWDYAADLFETSQITAMFDQYTGMIDDLILGNEDYQLLPSVEDLHFIETYNRTGENIPPVTLDQLFINQVRLTPHRNAVIYETEQITYQELHQKSNQIAWYLREHGVKRGNFAGVLARRSIATIINIMGIIKSGATYVPIDPEYPEERRSYIISHSQCQLCLEPDLYVKQDLARYPEADPPPVNQPEDLAYVIYTSGSTGRPKGVMITHQAVTNTIIDINQKFKVNEQDRIMGISSMCFDLSVYDIFGALSTGASLVLVRDQREMVNLIQTVEEQQITIWNSVPVIMGMAMDILGAAQQTAGLRLVMLSGDWIPMDLPEKIKSHCPNAVVISLGGATEASIWSIYHPIEKISPDWKSIPYGRPLANQSFYVLNIEGQLCPADVPGELYIGGTGLAQGYLNDEEKTRNAFIKHPEFGDLYRTGDFGVWRRKGYIEFLGRKDHQVKIRGFRIELGEIETNLLKQRAIKQAVVIDRADANGKQYLCAYLVADQMVSTGAPVKNTELKEHLAKALPEYMIPSYFVYLESIPLTPNGKVDRKQLPEPDIQVASEAEYVAPRNEIETQLVDVWQRILGINKVGINDNFFELGGSSVQLIEMHTAIEQRYPGKIKITDIFAFPNIAKLVELIGKSITTKDIAVNQIIFPKDYFTTSYSKERFQNFRFQIKDDLFKQLCQAAAVEQVELQDVLLMIYLYLLADITGQQHTGLEVMVANINRVESVWLNLAEIESFSGFFTTLRQKRNAGEYPGYPIQDISRLVLSKVDGSVLMLFYRKNLLNGNYNLVETYDLVLEFDITKDHIDMEIEFSSRLHEDKIKEFMNNYFKLIQFVVGKMDNSSVSRYTVRKTNPLSL